MSVTNQNPGQTQPNSQPASQPNSQPTSQPAKRMTVAEAFSNMKNSPPASPAPQAPAAPPQVAYKIPRTPTTPVVENVENPPIPPKRELFEAADPSAPQGEPQEAQGESSEEDTLDLIDTPPEEIDYKAKWEELNSSTDLPDSWLDRVRLIDGEPITIRELEKGYLRRSHHSRLEQQALEVKKEWTNKIQDFNKLVETLKENPDQAYDTLGNAYGETWVQKVAERYNRETQEIDRRLHAVANIRAQELGLDIKSGLQNAQVQEAMVQELLRIQGEKKTAREVEQLRRENEEFKAAQQAAQQSTEKTSAVDQFKANYNRFAKGAMEELGIKNNALSNQELQSICARVMLAKNLKSLSKEVVKEAAEILKEEISERRKASQSSQAKVVTGAQTSVKPSVGTKEQARMTVEEAFKRMKR